MFRVWTTYLGRASTVQWSPHSGRETSWNSWAPTSWSSKSFASSSCWNKAISHLYLSPFSVRLKHPILMLWKLQTELIIIKIDRWLCVEEEVRLWNNFSPATKSQSWMGCARQVAAGPHWCALQYNQQQYKSAQMTLSLYNYFISIFCQGVFLFGDFTAQFQTCKIIF